MFAKVEIARITPTMVRTEPQLKYLSIQPLTLSPQEIKEKQGRMHLYCYVPIDKGTQLLPHPLIPAPSVLYNLLTSTTGCTVTGLLYE